MKNKTAAGVVAAAGAAVVLFALSVPGQQEGKQERPLRHDAAAIVKLVSVRVLGPDGRPVTDLRKEDFALYEDGQRKTITEFEVHAMTDAGMTVAPEPPHAAKSAIRGGGAIVRKIFFFLDQQASDQAGKVKARNAALRFLDTQVRPGDEVAVIGFYAMSGFYIREYLTSDMQKIRRAINKANEAPPRGGDMLIIADDRVDAGAVSEGINVWSAGGESGGQGGGAGEASEASPAAGGGAVFVPGTAAFQRRDFVPRMVELVEVFKTIPGTKSLVLFTARDMGPEAERLGKLFGGAGTTVFAVNTQDWKMSPMGREKVHFIWWDHSLKDLSAASGGKYFADINEVEAMTQDLQSLTGNFYILGYYVRETWEGKYHKIRVEVARPEARILVQDGYADPKPFAQMSDFERDIQLIDLAWADRPVSPFQTLAVDPLIVLEDGIAQACVLIHLEVNAKAGVPPVRNEVYAFLRDESGASALARRWEMDFSRYDGKNVCAHIVVPVAAGGWEFRMVVRDLVNGEACIGRATFKVPAAAEEGILLSSPLLFEEGTGTAYMRLPARKAPREKGKAGAEPSLIDFYRLIPKDGRLVVGETSPGARKLTAIVPFEIRPAQPDEPPILSVEAKFVSKSGGEEIPLKVVLREHRTFEGKPDVLVADILLPDVSPGSYVLEISLEDVGTEQRAEVVKPLVIR
jgi:VWFA-related protein